MQRKNIFRLFLIAALLGLGTQGLMAQQSGGTKLHLVLTDPVTGQNGEYDVYNFSFNVARIADRDSGLQGKPVLRADASVMLTVKADKHILQWAADPAKGLNGKIMATDTATGKTIRELSFIDSNIRSLSSIMTEDGAGNHYLELYLDLGPQLTIDGIPFKLKKSEL